MMGLYRKQRERQSERRLAAASDWLAPALLWLAPALLWLAPVLLWLAFALMVTSAGQKSATVDEQSHLFRGAAYLKTGATHFLLGHPLGANTLAALPLLTEPNLALPLDTPAWESGNWSIAGDAFLWRLNADPLRLLFLGRLPLIWLTLLLGALVFRWGRELAGPLAGLVALALLLLDPNVLAHGRLITDDMPVTAAFLLTIYAFWRYARTGSRRWLLLTGVGLGLAALSKFSAALLLPTLGLLALWLAWQRRAWGPLWALLPVGLIGWGMIWLFYGLELRPLPGGAFWDDLFWVFGYFGKEHGSYLLGQASAAGWWYYFPVAYALKTPLPTMGLLLAALGMALWRWRQGMRVGKTAVFLLLPPALYLLVSLTSSLNIGYRHLLPMLPFFALAAAVTLCHTAAGMWAQRAAVAGAVAIILITLGQWPDYIPYFNLLAGGPANSWRRLSDSNVDWGQDLPALAAWQRETGQPLKLSYFGTAHPSAYGLMFEPLPTWAPGPEQGNPARQAYNPANPAPGFYAISVTNLHGVVLGAERDAFAWFRQREPLARIGSSIFIYVVEADGPPVDVAFSGVRPGNLAPELAGQWPGNNLRPRWFAAASSLIWPGDGGWLAVAREGPLLPELSALWPEEPAAVAGDQALYRLPPPPPSPWTTAEVDFGPLTFLGWRPSAPGLLTAWRVEAGTERPLKLFVHVLDEAGEIITQWDGLDVAPTSWQPGDLLLQAHVWAGWEAAAGHALRLGVYDGETGERTGEPLLISLETLPDGG